MHSDHRPGAHAEHARHYLGLPAHRRGPHGSTGNEDLPPAGDNARPIRLGVDHPYACGPDHKMVDVGAAPRQGQVVQYHPARPRQFFQEGGSDHLSRRPPAQRLGSERGQRTAMAPAPAAARASSNQAGPGRRSRPRLTAAQAPRKATTAVARRATMASRRRRARRSCLHVARAERPAVGDARLPVRPGHGERRARHPEMVSSTGDRNERLRPVPAHRPGPVIPEW